MPRTCTVCSHPDRRLIDQALVDRELTYRDISQIYGVSNAAVGRHVDNGHISQVLAKAYEAEERAEGSRLLSRIEDLHARTLAILDEAEGDDNRVALAAIREARSDLELIGEVTKELDRAPVLNLNLSAEWLEIRAVIVSALEAHPDARQSVLRALEGGVSDTGPAA
jgi:hypothetical protein